jgi:hypothetical protein
LLLCTACTLPVRPLASRGLALGAPADVIVGTAGLVGWV